MDMREKERGRLERASKRRPKPDERAEDTQQKSREGVEASQRRGEQGDVVW